MPKSPPPTERNLIERVIQNTDNQIDRPVYQIYNLTKEEIKIIEDATK